MSPRGRVPVLVVHPDGAAGKTAVFESLVINEYLDETHPPRLLPEDPLERARLRGFFEMANDSFAAMASALFGTTEEKLGEGRAQLKALFERLEPELSGGGYFAGETFGLVDIAFAPALHRFAFLERASGIRFLDGPERVVAWAHRVAARPSVPASVPPDFAEAFAASLRERGAFIASRLR